MAIHPQFRSSDTPGAAPDVADMLKHEVAINTADAKLFAKDVNDVLKEYSITGETITRFVISQADATANPAQVGERIRIVATSETISLPFPQDPVQGQTITIITHQDSDAGYFAELSSTGIPFRVEDTESTAPHVLRFSVDDNGTETSVDGEYVLTFTGAFWTLDNPVSLTMPGAPDQTYDPLSTRAQSGVALKYKVNTVPLASDLQQVTDVTDGAVYLTRGYAVEGSGAGIYRYEKILPSNANKTIGLPHVSSVGYWRLILPEGGAYTPMHEGALLDFVSDDTQAVKVWASKVGNLNEEYKGIKYEIPRRARVSETIKITGTEFVLKIGSTLVTSDYGPALEYIGPDGQGPEPENCTPLLWLDKCSRFDVDVNLTCDHSDGVKSNVIGLLITGRDSIQRGYGKLSVSATNLGYSWALGLEARPESTAEINVNGTNEKTRILGDYNDDVLENVDIGLLRASNCRESYISARTSDGSIFRKIEMHTYSPGGSSPDMGVRPHAAVIETLGNSRCMAMEVYHFSIGVYLSYVEWGATTGTQVQAPSHGLAVDDRVYFPDSTSWSLPSFLDLRSDPLYRPFMWVVSASVDQFEVSHEQGGSAINLAGGSGSGTVIKSDSTCSAIKDYSGSLDYDKIRAENVKGKIYEKIGTNLGREIINIGVVSSADHIRDIDDVALQCPASVRIDHASVSGHMNLKTLHGGVFEFREDPQLGEVFQVQHYLNNAIAPGGTVFAQYNKSETGDLTEKGGYASDLVVMVPGVETYHTRTPVVLLSSRTMVTSVAGNNATVGVSDASGMVVGQYVIFKAGDGAVMLGGLEDGTPYKIRSISGDSFTLVDLQSSSALSGITNGSGDISVYPCTEMFRRGTVGNLSFNGKIVSNGSITHGASTAVAAYSSIKNTYIATITGTMLSTSFSTDKYSLIKIDDGTETYTVGATMADHEVVAGVAVQPSVGGNHYEVVVVYGQYSANGTSKIARAEVSIDGTVSGELVGSAANKGDTINNPNHYHILA